MHMAIWLDEHSTPVIQGWLVMEWLIQFWYFDTNKENILNWRKLVDLVENTELEKAATLCLIKMHQNFHWLLLLLVFVPPD